MDYDDFYENYSEFDQQIDEFKQSLMLGVKKDFLAEMEKIKKENVELQSIKNNWKNIQEEYRRKESSLESAKSNAMWEAKKMRLSELMKDRELVVYKTDSKYTDKPKCDKCNENRVIKYITPLGKDAQENCECANKNVEYFPIPYVVYEFKIDEYDHKLSMWYKKIKYNNRDEERFEGDSVSGHEIFNENMEYKDVGYHTVFKTQEECQKYCDYLNKK